MNGDEITELMQLRAQRDGWRAVAVRLLQGDFGDIPPVEILPETMPTMFDKTDRTPELADELRHRAPWITEIETSTTAPYAAPRTGLTSRIEATLGGNARIHILRAPEVSDAFKLSVYHYSQANHATLLAPREVSFELLLRYVDLLIAGYRARQLDEDQTSTSDVQF